jgi:hypothetical protein
MAVRVYLSGDPVHDRVLEAFYEGCAEEKEFVRGFKYEPSDLAVIFGVFKSKIPKSYPRGAVLRQQRENNLDVVVLETGYINRGDGETHHYAAGFNGLNGRADFKNKGMPDDRVKKLGVELKPWRRDGKHILLCGQVPWDASVDMIDYGRWLHAIANRLQELTPRHIRFRPHPAVKMGRLPGCEFSTRPIREDFEDAWAVVAYNSNSVVEGIIQGIPGFSFDAGSMATSVCNMNIEDIENPQMPDRQQWLNDLAYCQWTLEEMRSGEAWKHLFR